MFSSKNSEFNILTDLNGYIQQLLDITKSENNENQQQMIQDRNPSLLRICYCVEKVLSDGLKDVNFISSTTMWDFLQNLPQCLPDTQRVIELAKDCSKNSIGRGRVLIRLALNEGLLEEYISSLCFSQEVLKSYYKESALLRNSEFLMMFQSLISMLSHIQFSLVVKDKDLDKANYWEDIALTLLTNVETRVVKRFIMVPTQDNQDNQQQQQQQQPQSSNDSVQQVQIQAPQPIKVEPIKILESVASVESLESLETSSIDQSSSPVTNQLEEKQTFSQLNENGKGLISSNSNSSLNLDELESALSELTSEENFTSEPISSSLSNSKSYEKVIITEKDYEQWEQLIENLIKSKKTVLLDYGAKGSAITVLDSCLESLWLSIDKILTNEFRKLTNNQNSSSLYSNLWEVINGISSIISSGNNNKLIESNEPIQKIYQDNSFKRVRAFYFRAIMSNQKISNYLKQYFGFSKDNDSQGILIRFYNNNSIVLQYDYMVKFFNLLEDLDTTVLFKLKWDRDAQQLSLPKTKITKVIKKKVIKKTIVTVKKNLNSSDSNIQNLQQQSQQQQQQQQQDVNDNYENNKLMNSLDSNIQDNENQEFDEEEKKLIEFDSQEEKKDNENQELQQQLKEIQDKSIETIQIEPIPIELNQIESTPIQDIINDKESIESIKNDSSIEQPDNSESVILDQSQIESELQSKPSTPKQEESIEKLDQDIENNNQLNDDSTTPDLEKKILNLVSSQDSIISIDESQHQQQQQQQQEEEEKEQAQQQEQQEQEQKEEQQVIGEELTRDKIIIERRSTLSEVMKKEKEKSSTTSSTTSIHKGLEDEQDKDNINSEQFQNLLSSLKTSQESIEFRYKSDPTYSSYTDSYNNDPFSTSYMGSSSFTNDNEGLKSSSLSSSLIDCQFISEYEVSDGNGKKTKRSNKNILVGEDGQLFINQLYRTNSIKAAYYSQGVCPGCHIQLEKLGFFKTRICYYTGKYYCTNCHSNQKSLIPARILWKWEFKLFPVSDAAKSYLTRNLETPFDIFQFNPECLNLNPKLPKIFSMREKLFFIGEYIESCRNKATLEIPKLNSYFVCDNVYTYSIMDLEKIYTSNTLETTIQQVMEKYINHVTKDCIICKGKGFICEYCNNDDELIFSWMSLDVQNFIKCDKCLTLSHKKCAIESKDTCPKCLRIAKIKSKSSNNTNHTVVNLQIK